MMNNCAVRTVMSGVLGSGLGLVFGVVMGSMDAGVSSQHPYHHDNLILSTLSFADACLQRHGPTFRELG